MITTLLLVSRRIDPRIVLHEQFDKQAWDPETWRGIIMVSAAIMIFLVMLHFVLYYEKRSLEPVQIRNPQKMFNEVLRDLHLTVSQRALLGRVVRDLALQSPTLMMLSPQLFAQTIKQWQECRGTTSDKQTGELQQIAAVLFPEVSSER